MAISFHNEPHEKVIRHYDLSLMPESFSSSAGSLLSPELCLYTIFFP